MSLALKDVSGRMVLNAIATGDGVNLVMKGRDWSSRLVLAPEAAVMLAEKLAGEAQKAGAGA